MTSTTSTQTTWHWCASAGCVPNLFYDWQTLIGAGIALLAAYIAARAVWAQIELIRSQEAERIAARRRAARATLPLTLSVIVRYAEDVAVRLVRLEEHLKALRKPSPGIFLGDPTYSPPSIPSEAIPSLERMIEVAEPEIADRLAALIRAIQILSGRADEKIAKSGAPFVEITSAIVDAGRTLAIVNSAFSYARGRGDTVVALTWEDVRHALLSIVLRQGLADLTEAERLTKHREDGGESPLFDAPLE
jgi:hypothetical protein